MDPDYDKYLDIINEVQKAKIGDPARVADIRERLLAGKSMYKSDKNYLEERYGSINRSSHERMKDLEEKVTKMERSRPENTKVLLIKSEGTTTLLSLLLGFVGVLGIGHLYIGKNERGIAFLAGGILLIFLSVALLVSPAPAAAIPFLIGYPALFTWSIIDSRDQCKKYNDFLLETGKRMW